MSTINQYEILRGKNNMPRLHVYKEINTYALDEDKSIDAQMWFLAADMNLMDYDAEHIYALSKDNDGNVLGVYLVGIGDTKECDMNNRNLCLFLLLTQ